MRELVYGLRPEYKRAWDRMHWWRRLGIPGQYIGGWVCAWRMRKVFKSMNPFTFRRAVWPWGRGV